MNLKSIGVFMFDLDGTLWIGKENPRYLGGKEVIRKLKDSGRKTFVLTNDSTHSAKRYIRTSLDLVLVLSLMKY